MPDGGFEPLVLLGKLVLPDKQLYQDKQVCHKLVCQAIRLSGGKLFQFREFRFMLVD